MRTTFTVLGIFLITMAQAQFSVKEIDKSLAKIGESRYASRYEVSNYRYATFLYYLRKEHKDSLYRLVLVDSTQWRSKQSYNEPYVEYYFRHPAYRNYPVVNISHMAARSYCEWLTEIYNADPKRKFKKVVFRLPDEKEWMMAARAGDSTAEHPWKGEGFVDKKGIMVCNCSCDVQEGSVMPGTLNDAADITAPVGTFRPNDFGLHNMCGNVAEMVSDPTLVKGGGWRDANEMINISGHGDYDGLPRTDVGFRFFMDVVER
jgi:formylglycine-generating enzyme required for sulfatase activity